MKTGHVLRAIWLAGGLALLLGAARDTALGLLPAPRELPRVDGATGRPWITGDFVPVRGLQPISDPLRLDSVHLATSWRDGDLTQGRAETAWFRATRPTVHVGIAGYTRMKGIRVWAEFRAAAGTITRVDCTLPNPHEQWSDWAILRPAGATAVRIIAEDRTSATFGWLAISHPYRIWPAWVTALYLHAQVYATVALALTLLWGPGLLLLRRETPPELRVLVLLAAGPLALATGGVLIWSAGAWIPPGLLGGAIVTILWISLGVAGTRRQPGLPFSPAAQRALAVAALLVVAATAKSTYSGGPEGETFRGTISRNLAVGDRIDSRFAFYVVQAAAHHLGPAAPATERFYYPWTFFSRGPLAGLTATPVVLATGGQPPAGFPDQRWSPFDREGFAAYRITMIALAALIIPAVFLVLVPLLGEAWALVAAGLIALSPFGVHEIMFTWPKWIATAWLVTSFGLVHARRPGPAGVALGIGFLFHPLVLLWTPWLALWSAGVARRFSPRSDSVGCSQRGLKPRAPSSTLRPALVALARLATGAGLLVLPWMLLGRIMPHLPDTPFAGQGGFFSYLLLADSHLCTWGQWLHARWLNFANTFLPLHLLVSDESFHHFRLNSAYEPAGLLVKFAFVWWNTLPFALGLGLWVLSTAGAARMWRESRPAALLFVAGPAVLMIVYWGMDPLGLMRECGHPLFIAIIALLCAVAAHSGGWPAHVLAHRAVPWLQLPETLLMLWLTTLLNPANQAVLFPDLDAGALAVNLAALATAAWLLARHRAGLMAATG